MNPHPLSCRCGTLQGQVGPSKLLSRAICYCTDCQAYAHALSEADAILDQFGGTEVVATYPGAIAFTRGVEALACLSLTERGLLRWYARCCNTPIGNTPRNFKMAYVGLVHNCLEKPPAISTEAFGPVSLRVNTRSARGPLPPMAQNTLREVSGIMKALLRAWFDGSYRSTPFFSSSGKPVVSPRVLTPAELEHARNAVRA
jgi:hypothetical protein